MNNCFDLIQKFLENPEAEMEKFMDNDCLVWIDWREYDTDIIDYFNQKMEKKVEVELVDKGKAYGQDIVLKKGEKALPIPYQEVMDRDITIQYLNDFIRPDYEIRWFLESLGNDTLAFLVLSEEDWKDLEAEFGVEKVEYYFLPIDLGSRMFDLDMEEVDKLLSFRR